MPLPASRIALGALVLLASCTSGQRTTSAERDSTTSAGARAMDGNGSSDSSQISQLASQVTRSALRVHRGDVVMIAGGKHTVPVMEAMAIEALRQGAQTQMLLSSERVTRARLKELPEENLSIPSQYFADWLKTTTVYIGLPSAANAKAVFADVPEARIAKFSAGFAAIYDMLDASPVRGAYIDYPSEGGARDAGMPYADYARMQLAAIGTDPQAMAQSGARITARLKGAKKVHITSPAGTDLTLMLAGRSPVVDAGMLAPGAEKEKQFIKRWITLPGGSVAAATGESSASGVVVVPKDLCKFQPLRDARYQFSGGALTGVTAKQGESCLKEQIAAYGEPMRRIGQVGMGLNPELRVVEENGDYRPWNSAGLVGVFLGDNTMFGGSLKVLGAVTIGIPITHATLEVDGEALVRDGQLVGAQTVSASARQ
jgi:aminopeptidase